MDTMTIKVHREDDSCRATVDQFSGVFATGDDLEELRLSLEEGIALMLARSGENEPQLTLGPLRPEPSELAATAALVQA
jgi:predicted RNase H-like HicB family nuclease